MERLSYQVRWRVRNVYGRRRVSKDLLIFVIGLLLSCSVTFITVGSLYCAGLETMPLLPLVVRLSLLTFRMAITAGYTVIRPIISTALTDSRRLVGKTSTYAAHMHRMANCRPLFLVYRSEDAFCSGIGFDIKQPFSVSTDVALHASGVQCVIRTSATKPLGNVVAARPTNAYSKVSTFHSTSPIQDVAKLRPNHSVWFIAQP